MKKHLTCESCISIENKATCDIIVSSNGQTIQKDCWWLLRNEYSNHDIIDLEKRLYLIAQSNSEVPLILRIKDNEDLNLYVYKSDGHITTIGSTARSIDSNQTEIKDSIFVSENLLNNAVIYDIYNTDCDEENIQKIYDFLRVRLIDYYKEKGIELIIESDYEPLSVYIKDIKSEVLNESFFSIFSAYERLILTFQLDIIDRKLKIGTSIDARLSSGLFKPSSSKSFWHMDEEYEEDIQSYIKRLTRSEIIGWMRDYK